MTLSINGKTYEAGELIAYIEKLEKENLYYKDIIETNTAEWEEQGQRLVALEKENAELKCFIRDLIYENHSLCFHFSNTTCLFNSDYRNRAEELIGEKL